MNDLGTTYYYNQQFKRYITQFMAIFTNLQVEIGKNENKEPRLIAVPIAYASRDRVVAAIKGENTQNKMIRLPTMSAYMTGIALAPELRKGVGTQRRVSHVPLGGMIPDDVHVIQQRMPVPYNATFDLHIWSSNQEQHMQILEQILMIFDPVIQIQTSDDVFDWTKLTSVELTNIRPEENFPAGGDRRTIVTTLEFKVPILLSIPTEVHQRYIKDIYFRIGAIGHVPSTSEDILIALDEGEFEYHLVASASEITIDQN